jgi:FG-GAP repeat
MIDFGCWILEDNKNKQKSKMKNVIILTFFISYIANAQSVIIQPGTNNDPSMIKIESQNNTNKPRALDIPVVGTEERQKMVNMKTGSTVFDRDNKQLYTYFDQSATQRFWIGSYEILQVPSEVFPSPVLNNIGFGNAGDMWQYDEPSINFSGIFMAIGAPAEGANKGAVYLYKLIDNTTNYTFLGKIIASDGIAGDEFGSSVAMMNGYLVVGAPKHNTQKGAAYIFKLTVNSATSFTWAQTSKLTIPAGSTGDLFGSSVKIFRNINLTTENPIVIASSPSDNLPSPAILNFGSVTVFKENNTNVWSIVQTLQDPTGVVNEGTNMKIALVGNGIVGWAKNLTASSGRVTLMTYNTATSQFTNPVSINIAEKIFDFNMPVSSNPTTNFNSVSFELKRFALGLNNKASVYNFNTTSSAWEFKYSVVPVGFFGGNFGYNVGISNGFNLRVRDYANHFVATYSDYLGPVKLTNRTYIREFNSNNFPKGCMIDYYNYLYLGDGGSSATSSGRVFGLNTAFYFD